MKFKLEDYKDTQNITYAMHCKTVKEAESFYRFLDREGRKPKYSPGGEGTSYLKNKKLWFTYEENTVYYFNKDTIFDYRAIKNLHLQNVKVLEWSEYIYDWSNSCEYALEDNEEKVIFDLLKKTEALEVFALHNYPIDVESLFKMLETVAVMFYIKTKSFDCEGKDTIYDHINSDLFEIYKHIKTALAILGYGEIKINKLPKKYAQYKDCYKFCRDLMYSFPEQNNK